MDQSKNNPLVENVFRNQPIVCPWITSQPYPSTHVNKNRTKTPNNNCSPHWSNIPVSVDAGRAAVHDSSCISRQQTSSQFFYFLKLMQLFPDTHPATLHTVLTLCRNDFFAAVDKLLYAKRCKMLFNRRFAKSTVSSPGRCHPYNPAKKTKNTHAEKINNAQSGEKVIDSTVIPRNNPNPESLNDNNNSTEESILEMNLISSENIEQLTEVTPTATDPSKQIVQVVCLNSSKDIIT